MPLVHLGESIYSLASAYNLKESLIAEILGPISKLKKRRDRTHSSSPWEDKVTAIMREIVSEELWHDKLLIETNKAIDRYELI